LKPSAIDATKKKLTGFHAIKPILLINQKKSPSFISPNRDLVPVTFIGQDKGFFASCFTIFIGFCQAKYMSYYIEPFIIYLTDKMACLYNSCLSLSASH
jgi:hypothetical protein